MKVMNILKIVTGMWKRRNTRIPPLAILNEVSYDETTAIKALAKLGRASVGKCCIFENW